MFQPDTRGKRPRWLKPLIIAVLVFAVVLVTRHFIETARAPVSPSALMNTPLLLQSDYPDAVTTFQGQPKSVGTSGCGATCVAMAVRYLTGADASPQTLFEWAVEHNHYFGDGLGHEALTAMAEAWGLTGEWTQNDGVAARKALESGYPVIAHMGPGEFTDNGHYIFLRGFDESGQVAVNDPYSRVRSDTPYDYAFILSQLRRADSLMILRRK